MRISEQEQVAIQNVLEAGKAFGFGNMISHLQTAWAKTLVEMYGMDEKDARAMTSRDGDTAYPFAMQADLVANGEWDETGKRYLQ